MSAERSGTRPLHAARKDYASRRSVPAQVVPITDATDNAVVKARGGAKRFHAISNEPQMMLIAGNSGASVRAGARLDSKPAAVR